jgi:uncharacterized protein involved in response to NO
MSGVIAVGGPYGAIAWHGHEMVFGFLSAVVTGFLMTAVPNWTGRLPVMGWNLAALFLLWTAGRAAMFFAGAIGVKAAALIDAPFLFAVAMTIGREIIRGRNWRNLPVLVMVSLFAIGNLFWHSIAVGGGAPQIGSRWGIAVVAMLIALIGGRITPSFTRNWLMKTGRPAASAVVDVIDKLALACAGLALVCWLMFPVSPVTGALLLVASALHLLRLARWRGWRTASEPLVAILHVGYFWLVLGLAILGASAAFPTVILASTALHALTAGAAGVMILAVMTRATRGHTGRPLAADGPTVLIYVLVNIGAAARVIAPFWAADYALALAAASALWSGAFLLFAVIYGRYLLTPKLA